MNRKFLLASLILIVSASGAMAQVKTPENQKDALSAKTIKVETSDDQFSGKRKVKLIDLPLTANLTVSLETSLDLKKSVNPFERSMESAEITFVSTTGKREYVAMDNRFDFLVDGQSIKGSPARSSPATDNQARDNRELVIGVMDLNRLAKISSGRKVQMKIGENVFDLSAETLNKFKEFVDAARK